MKGTKTLKPAEGLDKLQAYGNIVMDFDDVLCHTSVLWYLRIYNRYEKVYKKLLVDKGVIGVAEIYNRPIYDMGEWLLRPELASDPKKKDAAMKALGVLFIEDMFSRDFYKFLCPTDFAAKVLGNPLLYSMEQVEHIYILNKDIPGTDIGKHRMAWVNEWFGQNRKIQMLNVPIGKNFGDVAGSIKWNLATLTDLEDITWLLMQSKKDSLTGKELLITEYKYSLPPFEVVVMADDRGATVSAFKNYKTIYPYDIKDSVVPEKIVAGPDDFIDDGDDENE